MKKALAILMVLAAVTGVAFADVADIAVSGDATLTWGMDLYNDSTTGFKNEANWKVSIPLLAKKDFITKGEGDAYAEIEIDDAEYYIIDEEVGDCADSFGNGDKDVDGITAKLFFGNVYAVIVNDCEDKGAPDGGPSFTSDNANIFSPIKDDEWDDDDTGVDLEFKPGPEAAGLRVGYKTDKYDVSAKLGSKKDWTTKVEDDQSKYAFGVDATVTPSDMISFGVTFNNAAWDGADASSIMSFGGKVEVKPVADVVINAGIDVGNDKVVSYDDAGVAEYGIAWDAMISAKYASLVEAGAYIAAPGASSCGANDDGDMITDIAPYLKLTDGGKVENLTASATFLAMNVLTAWDDLEEDSAFPYSYKLAAAYKYATTDVNYFKPFANVWGQNMSSLAEKGSDMVVAYEFGVEYGLFSNCTVTGKFAAGSTADDKMTKTDAFDGYVKTSAINNADSEKDDDGRLTLACKVTY